MATLKKSPSNTSLYTPRNVSYVDLFHLSQCDLEFKHVIQSQPTRTNQVVTFHQFTTHTKQSIYYSNIIQDKGSENIFPLVSEWIRAYKANLHPQLKSGDIVLVPLMLMKGNRRHLNTLVIQQTEDPNHPDIFILDPKLTDLGYSREGHENLLREGLSPRQFKVVQVGTQAALDMKSSAVHHVAYVEYLARKCQNGGVVKEKIIELLSPNQTLQASDDAVIESVNRVVSCSLNLNDDSQETVTSPRFIQSILSRVNDELSLSAAQREVVQGPAPLPEKTKTEDEQQKELWLTPKIVRLLYSKYIVRRYENRICYSNAYINEVLIPEMGRLKLLSDTVDKQSKQDKDELRAMQAKLEDFLNDYANLHYDFYRFIEVEKPFKHWLTLAKVGSLHRQYGRAFNKKYFSFTGEASLNLLDRLEEYWKERGPNLKREGEEFMREELLDLERRIEKYLGDKANVHNRLYGVLYDRKPYRTREADLIRLGYWLNEKVLDRILDNYARERGIRLFGWTSSVSQQLCEVIEDTRIPIEKKLNSILDYVRDPRNHDKRLCRVIVGLSQELNPLSDYDITKVFIDCQERFLWQDYQPEFLAPRYEC